MTTQERVEKANLLLVELEAVLRALLEPREFERAGELIDILGEFIEYGPRF
jgi:hypothetical protein